MVSDENCERLSETLVQASMHDGRMLKGWLRRGFRTKTWVIVIEPIIPPQQAATNPEVVEIEVGDILELNPIS